MKIKRFLNRFLATGFFSGYLPGAPGTFGSLVALILIVFFPVLTKLSLIVPLTFVGIIIANNEEKYTDIKDESAIVIDEFLGVFVTFISIPISLFSLLVGFILFRIFDIWKPLLIDKVQSYPSGIGVMADDILAGIIAQFILRFFLYIV